MMKTTGLIVCIVSIFLLVPSTCPYAAVDGMASDIVANIGINPNGTFGTSPSAHKIAGEVPDVTSPNGQYACSYIPVEGADERAVCEGFTFYDNGEIRYTISGESFCAVNISDTGLVAAIPTAHDTRSTFSLRFIDTDGSTLFEPVLTGGWPYGFSNDGDQLGIGTRDGLVVIDPYTREMTTYPKADQFAVSADGRTVAVAYGSGLSVFRDGERAYGFDTGFMYPRGIALDENAGLLGIIDKRSLKVFSLSDGVSLHEQRVTGNESFRDVRLIGRFIAGGVHFRDRSTGLSQGLMRVFDADGSPVLERKGPRRFYKTFGHIPMSRKPALDDYMIPWPVEPFDQMPVIFNLYESLYSNGINVHPGVDIPKPAGTPVYSVTSGVVKAVMAPRMDDGYWRFAIAPAQTYEHTEGWMYAHIDKRTVQFDVGDTIEKYDYLANLVVFNGGPSHLHFTAIADSGYVWRYEQEVEEWDVTGNPLLRMETITDDTAPVFENVFPDSRFGFCYNEQNVYLDPGGLNGEIDIFAKIYDYCGNDTYKTPPYETFYWIQSLPDNEEVLPRTLGQRRNHYIDHYWPQPEDNYNELIYKIDGDNLIITSDYFDMHYYMMLTNNDGDELAEAGEEQLAFDTTAYPDGDYRIFIEARDISGNATVDSMDVTFANNLPGKEITAVDEHDRPLEFSLSEPYPNPFNPATTIEFSLDVPGVTELDVYNIMGQKVRTLMSGQLMPGMHSVVWDGRDSAGERVSSGVFFVRLKAGDGVVTRRMVLMK